MFPTLIRLDSADPDFSLIASLIWTAAGGVLITNSKDLSEKTVITTGNTLPDKVISTD